MSGSHPTFLYVEDDPLSREVMELLLKQVLGYTQVITFGSSNDFMQQMRALANVPDVVFLDIQMQPHDGYEMLKIKVIAMTASVMATDVAALKSAGFDGMIGKPIMREAFPALLGRILSGESIWFIS
jgi:two-component system cell cycle response regulator DivK